MEFKLKVKQVWVQPMTAPRAAYTTSSAPTKTEDGAATSAFDIGIARARRGVIALPAAVVAASRLALMCQ